MSTDWQRVGRRVRRLRKQRGLSQKQVAGAAITPAYLSLIESGRRQPSAEVLGLLADRLGTTEEHLLTGRDPEVMVTLRLDVERARRQIYRFEPERGLALLDEVIATCREVEAPAAEAAAHEVRGRAFQKLDRLPEAIEAYDAASRLLVGTPIEQRVPSIVGRARALFLMGDVHHAIHELERCRIELNRRPAVDPTALGYVYAVMIGPYFEAGLPREARAAAFEAERLSVRVTDPDTLGCMHHNLAGVALSEGRTEEGLRALTRAQDCFTQLEWAGELAMVSVAQATIHIEKEQWDEAREHLEGALAALVDLPAGVDRARALNQLGRIERLTGHLERAASVFEEALGLLSEGDLNERGLAERELGLCDSGAGRIEAARRRIFASIDCYRASGNLTQVGASFKVLGDLEAELGDERTSASFYREGLEAATAAAV